MCCVCVMCVHECGCTCVMRMYGWVSVPHWRISGYGVCVRAVHYMDGHNPNNVNHLAKKLKVTFGWVNSRFYYVNEAVLVTQTQRRIYI